ncbi:MAG TPA: GNAT family N-acetyltransferase [Actinomycetaceae bacterium]|nr:GNAT family N-acetyltransferase [Actinomycetaceae bacterium]
MNRATAPNTGAVRIEPVTSREQLEAAWRVRFTVFVDEQGVPADVEVDDLDEDPTTSHVLAVDGERVVGTGRLLLDAPGHVHLGRLAVLAEHRGRGVGALLVRGLEQAALDRHATGAPPRVVVVLSAQEAAMGFYRALGYEVVSGERYLDAGIWHQDMARTLTR